MQRKKQADIPIRPVVTAMTLSLLALSPVIAQTADNRDGVTVINIQAPALGFQPNRVDAADFQRMRASTSDTASLLRNVPGVHVNNAGGVSGLPSIHGLSDDRLRIKVDGMDLISSCPNHMNPALSYVDPSQVEIAEVYAGITPVSQGGDSIGGTIIVETKAPQFAASAEKPLVEGEVGGFFRSNGNAFGLNLSALYATESVSISYSGATAQSDNYKAGDDFKQRIFADPANAIYTGRAGHTLPLDEVGSSAYKTRNHSLGIAWRNADNLLEAKIGIQDLPYQLYPNQRMDMLDNQQNSVNLRYVGYMDWGKLEARAYHEKVDHFMDFGADKRWWYGAKSGGSSEINPTACGNPVGGMSGCAQGMPMYTKGRTTGFSVKTTLDLTAQDQLRIGGELQQYRLDDWWPASGAGMWPNTFWNIRDGERDRAGLYVEWDRHINAQWQSLLGVRYERVTTNAAEVQGYNSSTDGGGTGMMPHNQKRDSDAFNAADRKKTDDNIDLTALARYQHSDSLDIEFGLAHKTRSPNLYERYAWSTWQMAALMNNFAGDGNGYVGDINLKPEKATTLSATFDWHSADREWEFKATPYLTYVKDYIDAVQWNSGTNNPRNPLLTDQFTVLRYANQSARLYGLDLSGKMPLGKTAMGDFGLQGIINVTKGKNRDTGDGLYNIMPLNATLILTHQKNAWDNALELVMVDAKDDISQVRNEIATPSYQLVNLRSSYAWKNARLNFGIENLFDKLYYLPTGGAYLGQGTTMTVKDMASGATQGVIPQWGTAVPGPGISFYAGVSYKF